MSSEIPQLMLAPIIARVPSGDFLPLSKMGKNRWIVPESLPPEECEIFFQWWENGGAESSVTGQSTVVCGENGERLSACYIEGGFAAFRSQSPLIVINCDRGGSGVEIYKIQLRRVQTTVGFDIDKLYVGNSADIPDKFRAAVRAAMQKCTVLPGFQDAPFYIA
jgi:hypothetical protein